MKFALSVLLLLASFSDLDRIARINQLKKEAKVAYQSGDFESAIGTYKFLLDSMEVDDPRIRLNLANAYFQSNDTTNALNNYGTVTESSLKSIKSTAYQQTGIIQHQQEKHKEALDSFKKAIKSDPTNEQARYNYEMLKKFLKEQEQQQDQKQDKDNKDNQDQENKDQKKEDQEKQDQEKKNEEEQKDQEKKDKEGKEEDKEKKEGEEKEQEKKEGEEKKEEEKEANEGEEKDDEKKPEEMPEGADQKMKEMKITAEKAKMILEALKNQEVQYIQQNKKKAKKRPKTNKPDW